MQKVTSSTLHSIGYDPVNQTMTAMFNHGKCSGKGCDDCKQAGHNGHVYTYTDVPPEKYAAVRDAESVGKAFGAHIKAGGYKFTKKPA